MRWQYNDGGRKAAGYVGSTGDCTTRAIAIATGRPYQEIYDLVNAAGKAERGSKRRCGKSSARTGVYKPTIRRILAAMGWTWTPTMHIGSGCKVHLADGELPMGRLIVAVSRHITCVINGVIHDTHDPQRDGNFYALDGTVVQKSGGRCVYGYWRKA